MIDKDRLLLSSLNSLKMLLCPRIIREVKNNDCGLVKFVFYVDNHNNNL